MLRKQLYYLTNDQLCAYQWRAGKLSGGQAFGADRAGMDAFALYLAQHRETPVYIVADLVEEDFQRHLLPHASGRAGRELLARRMSQVHRDTPYRNAVIQGRASDGRRDDRVLFSALTNPALVDAWLALLEQHQVPLAALYSATLLSGVLVKKLALAQPHLLLVTEQSGGLRQSYFQDRQLAFSRLTARAPGQDAAAAAAIVAELAKTRQFLSSTRLLARGELLQVAVLARAERIDALGALCEDGPELAWHFIDMESAAARLAIRDVPQLSDRLLLTTIGKHAPPSHYKLERQGRFYPIWQIRMGLKTASAAVLAISSVWMAANVWGMVQAAEERGRLRAETDKLAQRYQAAIAHLPPSVAKPANMKAAVQIEQVLSRQGPMPGPLVAILSGALDQVPQVKLNLLEWQVEQPADPGATPQSRMNLVAGASTPQVGSRALGIPLRPPQTLLIEADLALDQGNYRTAFATMNQLVALLAANRALQVEVVTPPLDVRPSVRLAGKAGAGAADNRASFTLRLVWTP